MRSVTKYLIALIILGLALVFAPYFIGDQGYVLVAFANYTIEGSLIDYGITLSVLAIGLWLTFYLLKLIHTTLILPTTWWQKRQVGVQANFLQAGIDYMTLGQWQQAINQFKKVRHKDRISSALQLIEVCQAQLQPNGMIPLSGGQDVNSKQTSQFAVIAQSLKASEYEAALSQLSKIKTPINKQPLPFQHLALSVYAHNYDWHAVANLLPKLLKAAKKQFSEEEYLNAEQELQARLASLFEQTFNRYVADHSVNQLVNVWQAWPKAIKQNKAVRTAYLLTLSQQRHLQLIEPVLLETSLETESEWLLQVLRNIYQNSGQVAFDPLFSKVQKSIAKQPDNKVLMTIYGYLAAGQRDHQLAKQALEQVVFSSKNAIDKRLYAAVLAELGELRHSIDVYKTL